MYFSHFESIVSLREWLDEDSSDYFVKEFGPLLKSLENSEKIAVDALLNVQKELLKSSPSEKDQQQKKK